MLDHGLGNHVGDAHAGTARPDHHNLLLRDGMQGLALHRERPVDPGQGCCCCPLQGHTSSFTEACSAPRVQSGELPGLGLAYVTKGQDMPRRTLRCRDVLVRAIAATCTTWTMVSCMHTVDAGLKQSCPASVWQK